MQNRYAGDIGDFATFGPLRALRSAGLTIGVNWFLVPDESHNTDGRHVHYLQKESYRACDSLLWDGLKKIVNSGKRDISSIEHSGILDAVYFSEVLDFSGKSREERDAIRAAWHSRALDCLSGADIAFADPDNGLIVPSARGKNKASKYVEHMELLDYYRQGSSVIYYQHKARRPDAFYIDQHSRLLESFDLGQELGFGLKFLKTSQRYFFFIMQPRKRDVILRAMQEMLQTPWKEHFILLNDKEKTR